MNELLRAKDDLLSEAGQSVNSIFADCFGLMFGDTVISLKYTVAYGSRETSTLDLCIRFHTILVCDRQTHTDGQTDRRMHEKS